MSAWPGPGIFSVSSSSAWTHHGTRATRCSSRSDSRAGICDSRDRTGFSRRGGPPTGDEIVLAESEDLLHWSDCGEVLRGRPRYFDERIGSGPPPVKTREGWLHIYHGVATHFQSSSLYQAGAVLLDLRDPTRVLARTRDNILEPREPYEQIGQVPNVVFPSGMVVRHEDEEGYAILDSELLIYYGAADTCVGLATATVRQLLAACAG
ncbi:MAG: hypothetical protein V2A76_07295 [Planctomycetota bacterium]